MALPLTPSERLMQVRECIRSAGGVAEVARALDLRDWAVRKWFNSGHVPVSHRGNRVRQLIDLANAGVEQYNRDALPGFEKELWTEAHIRPDLYS